jgi:2-amino-4-hydroxy-6-hydroxymethyldihydropteridine diphosphokinase
MNSVYLHTGTNLGDKLFNLSEANRFITKYIGCIQTLSPIYQTAAWGIKEQPGFLNQALFVKSSLTPTEILQQINKIEQLMGRIRVIKWGERLIDIDILFYNDDIVDLPELTIPHPELQNRNFVLSPLMDIAADYQHPLLLKNIKQLSEESPDSLEAVVYKPEA